MTGPGGIDGRGGTGQPPEPRSGRDTRLLRRASRSIAAQVAVAVAAVVLTMSAAVLYVDERQQHNQALSSTREAWETADDVDDPPAGVWLVIDRQGEPRAVTRGAPAAIQTVDPQRLPNGSDRVARQGRELIVWTGDRKAARVSAIYDLGAREDEEQRLFISLGLASLLGILGAAAVGAVIGRRAVRPLGAAMALQRRFVADASHELRTPLAVLQLRAQIMRRHLAASLEPSQRAELDRLVQDTKVMGDVVNDLLLSAELEHRPQLGEAVDLREIATDVVHSLQPIATQRSIELTAEAGDTPGPLPVNGAPAALRRALMSLVDNALAHTAEHGHVQVEPASIDGMIAVRVRDDGQGLDPAMASQLVRRFARGTGKDAGRRFGLGLALVDEVARAHGGRLDISGKPGAGATFTLLIPPSL